MLRNSLIALSTGALLLSASALPALAAGKTIAVSWKTFQEERWKTDAAAIKAVVEAAGNKYIDSDAQGSAQKQAADIEGLIAQKPDVIMVVAFDSDAILPSIAAISNAGIKSSAVLVLVGLVEQISSSQTITTLKCIGVRNLCWRSLSQSRNSSAR